MEREVFNQKQNKSFTVGIKAPWKFREDKSYVDVTKTQQEQQISKPHSNHRDKEVPLRSASPVSWCEMEYKVNDEELNWLEDKYVGYLKKIEDAESIGDRLVKEGFFSISGTPMGGNMILFHCEDKDEIRELWQEGNPWWKETFSDVRPWSIKEIVRERFVWITCKGTLEYQFLQEDCM